jgi:hypothetical protein
MKTARILLFIALAVLVIVAPVFAQTTPSEVPAGRALRVVVDHDGDGVTGSPSGYRLYLCPGTVPDCTTVLMAVIASTRVNNVVTFDIPAGVARGRYTLQASVFNPDYETKSAVLVFDAKLPAPSAPGTPRFLTVTTAADGTIGLRLLDVADVREMLLELPPLGSLSPPASLDHVQ